MLRKSKFLIFIFLLMAFSAVCIHEAECLFEKENKFLKKLFKLGSASASASDEDASYEKSDVLKLLKPKKIDKSDKLEKILDPLGLFKEKKKKPHSKKRSSEEASYDRSDDKEASIEVKKFKEYLLNKKGGGKDLLLDALLDKKEDKIEKVINKKTKGKGKKKLKKKKKIQVYDKSSYEEDASYTREEESEEYETREVPEDCAKNKKVIVYESDPASCADDNISYNNRRVYT